MVYTFQKIKRNFANLISPPYVENIIISFRYGVSFKTTVGESKSVTAEK